MASRAGQVAALGVALGVACGRFESSPAGDPGPAETGDASPPSSPLDAMSPPLGDAEAPDGGAPALTASAYRAAVMADKPIAYFRMNDRPATKLFDEVSGTSIGDVHGSLTFGVGGAIASEDAGAIRFGGGYVDLGDRFAFTGNVAFTIEVWVRPEKVINDFGHFFTKQDRSGVKLGFSLLRYMGKAKLERYAKGDDEIGIEGAMLPDGRVSHVVGTYDGTTLRLYVDGKLTSAATDGRSMSKVVSPALIGAEQKDSLAVYPGMLDELAIYDKELSAERIVAHRDAAF